MRNDDSGNGSGDDFEHTRGQWRNPRQKHTAAGVGTTQPNAEQQGTVQDTQDAYNRAIGWKTVSPTSVSLKHIIRIEPQYPMLSHVELALALASEAMQNYDMQAH